MKPHLVNPLLALLLSLAPLAGASPAGKASAPDPDREVLKKFQLSDQQFEKALSNFCGYLRIDTTNPPGNEKKGAVYLAGILKENGIDAQIFDTAEGRSCLYARLKGTGKKKAVVLLNHIDVVPAQASDWRYPPFGGEIHDGEIWGRGTLDMKGMGMMELEAMLAFKRLGLTLDRDLVFLATPDEEVGGSQGAQWFAEHKKELLKDCEFLLNEGSSIEAYDNGRAKYWGVDVGEKSVLWLALKTRGLAGHASMPQENSANNRLLRALARLADNPPAFTLLPEVQNFYEKIAHTEESPLRELYAAISKAAAPGNVEAARLLKKDLLKSSMLANTVSITVLKAGYKTNVIPAESYCELDCRLLPGVKAEAFIEQLKGILQDDSIEISTIQFEKADPSPFGSAMVEAIRKANQVENEGQKADESVVPVVPVVVPWFTDSHWFRDLGIKAYGFEPVEVDAAHLATMHGKDERVAVKSYRLGIERLMRILYFVSQD